MREAKLVTVTLIALKASVFFLGLVPDYVLQFPLPVRVCFKVS